jgi:hypothetical protein
VKYMYLLFEIDRTFQDTTDPLKPSI